VINEQTIEKLRTMRLHAMAEFIRTTLLTSAGSDLSSAEQIGMMVDHEWTARENRRLHLLLKNAKIPANVCTEEIWCEPTRGLDKSVIRSLATCQWVRAKQNVIVVGKTGVGKTFVGASLAQAACRAGFRALCNARRGCCTRLPLRAPMAATQRSFNVWRRSKCSCSMTS
jgi:DNA replication protein DnaC